MDTVKTETQRRGARAKVGSDEIVYLNFQLGNGAIVVDVSPEGLGFQAARPLPLNESLSFRLCAPEPPNIELAGTIVWLDQTRKRGGIHLDVPDKSRHALQEWQRKYLDKTFEAGSPEREEKTDPSPRAEAPQESPEGASTAQNSDARPAPRPPAANSAPPVLRPPLQNPLGRGPIFVSEWEYPPEESHTGRNVLVACVVVVLAVAIAGTYFIGGRRQFGSWLIHLGQSLSGAPSQAQLNRLDATNANALPPAQPVPPSAVANNTSSNAEPPSTEAAAPAASSAATPAPPEATPGAPSHTPTPNPRATPALNSPAHPPAATMPANSAPEAATPSRRTTQPSARATRASSAVHSAAANRSEARLADTTAQTESFSGAGASHADQAEVAQARKLLRESAPGDGAVAAGLLWSAVGKGNTQAEMMLADIYLEGRGGVHQNCQQAEVLLKAAQSANVPGASEKLEEVQTYGCR